MAAARQAMIDKRFGGNASGAKTGGAGSMRMKAKGAHKSGGGEYKPQLSKERSAVGPGWNGLERGFRLEGKKHAHFCCRFACVSRETGM